MCGVFSKVADIGGHALVLSRHKSQHIMQGALRFRCLERNLKESVRSTLAVLGPFEASHPAAWQPRDRGRRSRVEAEAPAP